MANLTKRQKAMQGKVVDTQKLYAIIDALTHRQGMRHRQVR